MPIQPKALLGVSRVSRACAAAATALPTTTVIGSQNSMAVSTTSGEIIAADPVSGRFSARMSPAGSSFPSPVSPKIAVLEHDGRRRS